METPRSEDAVAGKTPRDKRLMSSRFSRSRRRHTFGGRGGRSTRAAPHSPQPGLRDRSVTIDALADSLDSLDGKNKSSATTGQACETVMDGWLYKTSRSKSSKTLKGHRLHRRFRLTPHSLEYNQLLHKVKVRKRYPLTSIIDVIYNEHDNPVGFKLIFQETELTLEAPDQSTCRRWVKHIKEEWEHWNIACKQFNWTVKPSDHNSSDAEAYLLKYQGYFEVAKKYLECSTPGLVSSAEVAEKFWANAQSQPFLSGAESRNLSAPTSITHPKHNSLRRVQTKIGLAPKLQRSVNDWVTFSNQLGSEDDSAIMSNCNFAMIKYPRKGKSIPHERVFKMDFENLLIMWHQTEDSKFDYSRTLLTEHIVDVREGQRSDGFDCYPYDEMLEQSLSILVEGEKQTVPGGRKYAVMQSLDLVCDSPEEQKFWYKMLKQFISPKSNLFPSRFNVTDPTILYPGLALL